MLTIYKQKLENVPYPILSPPKSIAHFIPSHSIGVSPYDNVKPLRGRQVIAMFPLYVVRRKQGRQGSYPGTPVARRMKSRFDLRRSRGRAVLAASDKLRRRRAKSQLRKD